LMDHPVEVLTDVLDQFKLPRSDRIVPVTKLKFLLIRSKFR
jgi:hypothetical protein